MTDRRVTLKAKPDVHAELARLADEYGIPVCQFTDILLEYAMRQVDRVDSAIDERKSEGSAKARARRTVVVPMEKGRGTKS